MKREDLIKKWLNNELSASEIEDFEKLEDSVFNKEIIEEAKRFKASSNHKVADFDTFYKQLNTTNEEECDDLKTLPWKRILPQIAAALIIGLTLFFFLNRDITSSYSTTIAQKQTLTLPDNSSVILNAMSTITYYKNNWSKTRSLQLEGEAFFEVEKGETFDVITPIGKVSVLGTKFNVKQRDKLFEVYCYEGLVKVIYNNTAIRLPAGKAIRFANGKMTEYTITEDKPQWSSSISKFSNVPVIEVFEEFKRQYDVTIDCSQINTATLFTGAFEHNNMNNALKAITKPLQLTFEKKSHNRVIILKSTRE